MEKKNLYFVNSYILSTAQYLFANATFLELINLTKKYNVYYLVTSPKEARVYKKQIEKLTNSGVKIVFMWKCFKIIKLNFTVDYEAIDKLIPDKADVVYFRGLFGSNTVFNDVISKIQNREQSFNYTYNFTSVCVRRALLAFYLHIRDNSEIVQYMIDPQEVSLHQLNINKCKIKQCSYYKNVTDKWNCMHNKFYYKYLNKCYLNSDKKYKELDFVFGYSAGTLDRLPASEAIRRLINKETGLMFSIFGKDKYIGFNNQIEQGKYMKQLQLASTTMCIPSYDKFDFSISRFHEAIIFDCMPFIAYYKKHKDKQLENYDRIFRQNKISNVLQLYKDNDMIIALEDLTWEYIIKMLKLRPAVFKQIKQMIQEEIYGCQKIETILDYQT